MDMGTSTVSRPIGLVDIDICRSLGYNFGSDITKIRHAVIPSCVAPAGRACRRAVGSAGRAAACDVLGSGLLVSYATVPLRCSAHHVHCCPFAAHI
jgi:hypothetical protein